MMNLCLYNKFLHKPILLRCFSAVVTEKNPDKNQQTAVNVMEEKIKETNYFKENFLSLSKHWREKHDIYFGKDRDFVNFPTMTTTEFQPKVRMGIFPDEWFNALYPKIGVTGPYLLFWGGVLFLFQKEIWVIDSHFAQAPACIMAIYIVGRLVGKPVKEYAMSLTKKKDYFIGERFQNLYKDMAKKSIEIAKEDKAMVDVNLDIFQASKENVALQLELAYRNRVVELHNAVKKRLDYQVEKELSKQRFQRAYMLNWIVDSVVKDFTPQQEKATLAQCISDLKVLGNKLKTAHA